MQTIQSRMEGQYCTCFLAQRHPASAILQPSIPLNYWMATRWPIYFPAFKDLTLRCSPALQGNQM